MRGEVVRADFRYDANFAPETISPAVGSTRDGKVYLRKQAVLR